MNPEDYTERDVDKDKVQWNEKRKRNAPALVSSEITLEQIETQRRAIEQHYSKEHLEKGEQQARVTYRFEKLKTTDQSKELGDADNIGYAWLKFTVHNVRELPFDVLDQKIRVPDSVRAEVRRVLHEKSLKQRDSASVQEVNLNAKPSNTSSNSISINANINTINDRIIASSDKIDNVPTITAPEIREQTDNIVILSNVVHEQEKSESRVEEVPETPVIVSVRIRGKAKASAKKGASKH